MQYTKNIKAFPFEGTGLDRGRVAGFGVGAVIGGIRAAQNGVSETCLARERSDGSAKRRDPRHTAG